MTARKVAAPQPNTYLTPQQVADLMQVHRRTVERMIAFGDLPAYKFGRKAVRIRLRDLERMIGAPIESAASR